MGYRVLLVEDQPEIGQSIAAILRHHDYEVDWVQAAEAALEQFEQQRPDLVLTDIELPRMNGIELLRRIRQRDPTAKIVAMSGSGPAEPGSLLQSARDEGAVATLSKPFRFPELMDVLKEAIAV